MFLAPRIDIPLKERRGRASEIGTGVKTPALIVANVDLIPGTLPQTTGWLRIPCRLGPDSIKKCLEEVPVLEVPLSTHTPQIKVQKRKKQRILKVQTAWGQSDGAQGAKKS